MRRRVKLADLQESDLDIAGATAAWDRLVQIFPRDAGLLNRAAEYFFRWSELDRARAVWRSLRSLLLSLAENSGDAEEAISCYEQVLQNTTVNAKKNLGMPDLPHAEIAVSDRAGHALDERVSSPARPKVSENNDPRLVAIRAWSQIILQRRDEAVRRAWLARWEHAESPAEAFWAWRWWTWQMHDFGTLCERLAATQLRKKELNS